LAGIPKGLEIVGDRRILDRVVGALQAVTPDIVLVANDTEAARWLPGVAVLSDRHPSGGGLAGVETALHQRGDALVVAWDMPFVSVALLEYLLSEARNHESLLTLPESESPYGIEPFCAYYSARLLPLLSEFFAHGGGAAHDFIKRVRGVRRIPIDAIRSIGDPARLFFSVNTPDDLAHARTLAATR
jgi:molybdopterin-guanine dinucleotide biosynthesis protein A